jgi:hypothetical protein
MNRTVLSGAVLVLLGLLSIMAEWWYLQNRQTENEVRRAREREQAERDRAEALLADAVTALRRRDPSAAMDLLAGYLAHPAAAHKERAARLLAETRRATAAHRAAEALRELSDDDLRRLDAGGEPLAGEGPTDPLLAPIYHDTLRGRLPAERSRREAVRVAERAEAQRVARVRAQREGRVCASDPYKEMLGLARRLRKQYGGAQAMRERRKRALERLAAELKVGPEDQEALRKDLDEEEKGLAVRKAFAEGREAARKGFAALPGVSPDDMQVFDRLADRLAAGLTSPEP